MISDSKSLQRIFLFCLGLFVASAFCMKWMESAFIFKGEKFSIIGLELTYTKAKLVNILSGLDAPTKKILEYHLVFDFIFMIAVYPGIAALCLLGRIRSNNPQLKKVLSVVAALQLIAWICDILENYCLLKWLNRPEIGNEFLLYHFIVIIKWLIALGGAVLGIIVSVKRIRVKFMDKI